MAPQAIRLLIAALSLLTFLSDKTRNPIPLSIAASASWQALITADFKLSDEDSETSNVISITLLLCPS